MPVQAQGVVGVTDKEILIGSCSALEGPSKFLGTQTAIGANAYFKVINEQGGINKPHLKLIYSDDTYDPPNTEYCFDHLMKNKLFELSFSVRTRRDVRYCA